MLLASHADDDDVQAISRKVDKAGSGSSSIQASTKKSWRGTLGAKHPSSSSSATSARVGGNGKSAGSGSSSSRRGATDASSVRSAAYSRNGGYPGGGRFR